MTSFPFLLSDFQVEEEEEERKKERKDSEIFCKTKQKTTLPVRRQLRV
jgi:hypothetical protein